MKTSLLFSILILSTAMQTAFAQNAVAQTTVAPVTVAPTTTVTTTTVSPNAVPQGNTPATPQSVTPLGNASNTAPTDSAVNAAAAANAASAAADNSAANAVSSPAIIAGATPTPASTYPAGSTASEVEAGTPSDVPAKEAFDDAIKAEPKTVERRHHRPTVKDDYAISKYASVKTEKEADHVVQHLMVGVDKIIDISPTVAMGAKKESIMVGNNNIVAAAEVTIDGNSRQIILKPLGEGETNVTIRDKTGKVALIFDICVSKLNLERIANDLRTNLKEVEGLDVILGCTNITLAGEVLTPDHYGRIINEITDKSYGDVVRNKVTMSGITLAALAKKIEQELQVFAPTVRASVLNGKIILEGTVESAAVQVRALKRASWYLPTVRVSDPINKDQNNIEKTDKPLELIQNDIQVNPPPPKRESKLVRLSVYFVELSKNFLKTFGFKWQPGFTADPSISVGSTANGTTSTSGAGGFTFSGTLSSLFPTFNAPPSSASYGRILKTETLIVKSQDKGLVKDTQQIPTQTLGQNGTVASGAPVEVGFQTEITPTILQGQDVDLNIDLDQTNQIGNGVGNAPIVAKHHVTTRLYLKSGETAAVVGVNNQDVTTTFNRDDADSGQFNNSGTGTTTKPLFTLQRSKNQNKDRGQFVVFVSPQIIDNAAEGTEDLKKNFRIKSNN